SLILIFFSLLINALLNLICISALVAKVVQSESIKICKLNQNLISPV
ncbi:hypothetical protein ACSSV5_000001, partial [Psychroflexus sp. MBR-150]